MVFDEATAFSWLSEGGCNLAQRKPPSSMGFNIIRLLASKYLKNVPKKQYFFGELLIDKQKKRNVAEIRLETLEISIHFLDMLERLSAVFRKC